MAKKIADIVLETSGNEEEKREVLSCFIAEGVLTGHDLSSLLDEEVSEAFVAHLRPLAVEAWAISRRFKDSYLKIPSVAAGFCLAIDASSSDASVPPTVPVPVGTAVHKAASIISVKRSFTAFTRRSALGRIPLSRKMRSVSRLRTWRLNL